jgi:adenylate kinase family enzyme
VILKQYNIIPQLVITLEVNDELVYKRLEQRRFDPITGKHVMLLEPGKPLPSKEVLKRLVQDPSDSHPMIKRKLTEYRNFVPHIESEYKGRLIRINGEDTQMVIFRNFCEAIENVVVDEKSGQEENPAPGNEEE